jgi:hypothetical protein
MLDDLRPFFQTELGETLFTWRLCGKLNPIKFVYQLKH